MENVFTKYYFKTIELGQYFVELSAQLQVFCLKLSNNYSSNLFSS